MSDLQYSEGMNSSDLQVWNHSAFDKGESEDKASFCNQKPICVNLSNSLDSASRKENVSPVFVRSSVSVKSPIPVNPFHPNGAIVETLVSRKGNENDIPDENEIDREIEEIEIEINRLSTRLELLRLEKAERNAKTVEKLGRVVPAKFMEQKQSVTNNSDGVKKMEETLSLNGKAKTKVQRRAVSLGPSEIAAGVRKGVSLGPHDIITGAKPRQLGIDKQQKTLVQTKENRRKSLWPRGVSVGPSEIVAGVRKGASLGPSKITTGVKFPQMGPDKLEITPVRKVESRRKSFQQKGVSLGPQEIVAGVRSCLSLGPSGIVTEVKSWQLSKPKVTPVQQNRRKSCISKLQDIDEENDTKEKGNISSLSPTLRKTMSSFPITTMKSKNMKKEDGDISKVQTKKLFKETEYGVRAKNPMKSGRVVASRYNQNLSMRKRSLPDTDEDGNGINTKDRFFVEKSSESLPEISQNRVKKSWEIPSEVVIHVNQMENSTPESITKISDMLPRISTSRCRNGSPRDSGAAKRVAELDARKSYFSSEEDVEIEPPVFQSLSFAEEEDTEE